MKKHRPPKRRSPIAKAVTRLRPQVIPDKRADVLTKEAILDAMQALGDQPDPPGTVYICTKCGATSGNDWSQCNGLCPFPWSPHYAQRR